MGRVSCSRKQQASTIKTLTLTTAPHHDSPAQFVAHTSEKCVW